MPAPQGAEVCMTAPVVASEGGMTTELSGQEARTGASAVRTSVAGQWKNAAATEKVASVAGGVVLWAGLLLLPFFVILPFGARPGRNSACARHVARTVLLGTGVVHVWGAAFALAF